MTARPRQGLAVAAVAAAFGLAAPATAPAQLLPPALPALPAVLPTDPTALNTLLATLGIDTPAELGDVLATATPAQLATLVQALDPAAVQAALATLTPEELAAVTEKVKTLAAQPGASDAVKALAATLAGAASGVTPGGASGGGSTPPPAGGGTTPPPSGGGDTTAPPVNRALRAEITKAKLAKNRRSVRITLSCPAAAPACGVALGGTVAKRSAFHVMQVTVKSASTATTKIKLKARVAKRLRRKGGSLKLVAGTAGSTLGPATRTVKVRKLRR
jgi:hypothetical protein